jgi:hypothetical protein
MHIRTNTITPQERARQAGKLFDYFSVSIYDTLEELLVHTLVNHDNTVRFAREARLAIRRGHRDAHRLHELACEDKAHAHSIISRAIALPNAVAGDHERYKEILSICKRTLAIKV